VELDGMQMVRSGGLCGVNYERLSALYFDSSASVEQREALMKLMASFSQEQVAEFARFTFQQADHGRTSVQHNSSRGTGDDREASPPLPFVAAQDGFANALQYVQNIRYRMHDKEAGLEFDYRHRQANYRVVDLRAEQLSLQVDADSVRRRARVGSQPSSWNSSALNISLYPS
jgi:hypothetical protein